METKQIEIWDRSDLIDAINDVFDLDLTRAAVVTVDMSEHHAARGLSPGTLELLVANTASFLRTARRAGLPVIHVIGVTRPVEAGYMKRWAAEAAAGASPSPYAGTVAPPRFVEGAFDPDVLRGLVEASDFIIKTKKTFSCFHGTDLAELLMSLGATTVVLCGMDTNGSVQGTTFELNNLGYGSVVIADCCASTYGDDLHELAIEHLKRCLAWVFTSEEFSDKLLAAPSLAGAGGAS